MQVKKRITKQAIRFTFPRIPYKKTKIITAVRKVHSQCHLIYLAMNGVKSGNLNPLKGDENLDPDGVSCRVRTCRFGGGIRSVFMVDALPLWMF